MKLIEKDKKVTAPKTQAGFGNSFYRNLNGPKLQYRLVRFSEENLKAEKIKHIEHMLNRGFPSYRLPETVYMYYPDAFPPSADTKTPPHVKLVPESRLPYSNSMMKVRNKKENVNFFERTSKDAFLVLDPESHSIIYKGEPYELTLNQFRVIECLFEKSKTKFPSVKTARMLGELEIGTDRLPKIFYDQKQILDALITKGERRGSVKLKLD